MTETPETIYLIPGEDVDGAPCMVWCDDPAPSYACDPAEAVKYVRVDKHQEIIDRQVKAAKMGTDAAKKSAAIMQDYHWIMRASKPWRDAYIKRLQAEAVEHYGEALGMWLKDLPGSPCASFVEGITSAAEQAGRQAQRLRQQADEAERAGGEK